MLDTYSYISKIVIPGANALLPDRMQSDRADALSFGIGVQESHFLYRRQIGGPARSFWQFEVGTIKLVLEHGATREPLISVLKQLNYDFSPSTSFDAIVHNDVLAAVYTRLLLWSDVRPLPELNDVEGMWQYYLRTWRPGKPRISAWPVSYMKALEAHNAIRA